MVYIFGGPGVFAVFFPVVLAAEPHAPPALSGSMRAVVIEIDVSVCDGPNDPRIGLARLGYLTPAEVEHIIALRQRSAPFAPIAAPYDTIDVSIEGGAIQFNGRRESYEPLVFRLQRGEVKTVTFLRVHKNRVSSTEVEVAFHGQGLHFDLDRRSGDPRLVKGRIVVPESREGWSRGDSYRPDITLESKDASASEAQGIRVRIRYAGSRASLAH